MAVSAVSISTKASSAREPDVGRISIRARVLTMLLLVAMTVSLVVALPALHGVARAIAHVDPLWLALAGALELASCASFVVVFRYFFAAVPAPAARELAWTEMGSGALLPGGGVGSLAVGGWLLHLAGTPTREIVRSSSSLFFFTSAVNVLALIAGGSLLASGLSNGSDELVLAAAPIVARRRRAPRRSRSRVCASGTGPGWRPRTGSECSRRHRRGAARGPPPGPATARRDRLPRVRHRRALDDAQRGGLLPPDRGPAARLHHRLPRQPDPRSRRRWRPRRRLGRHAGPVRRAGHSGRRRGAHLPRHRLLDPQPRRPGRLPTAAPRARSIATDAGASSLGCATTRPTIRKP